MNSTMKNLNTRGHYKTRHASSAELQREHPFPPTVLFTRPHNTIGQRTRRVPKRVENRATLNNVLPKTGVIDNHTFEWGADGFGDPRTLYCQISSYIGKQYSMKTGHISYDTFDCRTFDIWNISSNKRPDCPAFCTCLSFFVLTNANSLGLQNFWKKALSISEHFRFPYLLNVQRFLNPWFTYPQ